MDYNSGSLSPLGINTSMEGIDAGSLGVWPRSDEVDQGGEKTLGVFDERMVNFNVLRQRSPHSWPPSP